MFVVVMETLFLRLSRVPAESIKLKIIRYNLKPLFVDKLALTEVNSVAQLTDLCRKISTAEEIKKSIYNNDSK